MRLHLLRHGRTTANERGLYCGQTDIPVSEAGLRLLEEYKEQNIYPKDVDLFFTSGFIRPMQTIEKIYGAVEAEIIPELAEFCFGDFEMKTHGQLDKMSEYRDWLGDETGLIVCPGGESRKQFTERALKGYGILLKKAGENVENVLLASHGGTIACIMSGVFPDIKSYYDWIPEPGRGFTLIFESGGLKGYETI